MKVYIAGPMTGLPEFNYPAFNAAAAALIHTGHEPLNPTGGLAKPPADDMPWEWYMRRGLRQVLDAEGIALLPGWVDSRGARLEHEVGNALGIEIRPLVWWTGVTA